MVSPTSHPVRSGNGCHHLPTLVLDPVPCHALYRKFAVGSLVRPLGNTTRSLRYAQFRPCRLAPDRLAEVATWAEQYRSIWDDRFDRLDQQLSRRRRNA